MSRAALMGSAALVGPRPSFVSELSFQDLQRLRKVVRKVHMAYYPSHLMTDHEADRIIESFGPKIREMLIKTAVDKFNLE